MLVISDIHLATDALRRIVQSGETILILGDLVNLSDYRTGEGVIAEIMGLEFARDMGEARARGDYDQMRALWVQAVGDDRAGFQEAIGSALREQYQQVATALAGGRGYAIHGNVDRPSLLQEVLPPGIEYVHGETREINGRVFGFAGGGIATPVNAEGEITDQEMARILDVLGPVDVLCSHVPPAVDELRTDVVTGRSERGSEPILDYLKRHMPTLHLFGDIHQPMASRWRVGVTMCRNVGYFRATGRPFHLELSDR